jgi:L,D-transpeptidase catalytic domain/Putative peptidoglycan binding domain/PKD domain
MLTASGGSSTYRWDLGDGTFAEGAVVQHTYAAGDWRATVTTDDGGSASVSIHAEAVALTAPPRAQYGRSAVFHGTVVPAAAGVSVAIAAGRANVATGTTAADGTYTLRVPHLRTPGPYVARTALASSVATTVVLHPRLRLTVVGAPLVGGRFTVAVRLLPAAAGPVRLEIRRRGRVLARLTRPGSFRRPLRVGRAGALTVSVGTHGSGDYARTTATTRTVVLRPSLQFGARGPSVRELERRLKVMRYAVKRVDGYFGSDNYDAVLAFQKVNGLARTGRVDAELWRRILHAHTPQARYRGTHVEVDKTRQVLFEVRDGKVALVVQVSTGATGNTPLGVWHVYRRVTGFDWVLYYPTYFLRGFAIHGYPSVPPYPASHGCVRVPMWVAQRLYALNAYGATIYVYV